MQLTKIQTIEPAIDPITTDLRRNIEPANLAESILLLQQWQSLSRSEQSRKRRISSRAKRGDS